MHNTSNYGLGRLSQQDEGIVVRIEAALFMSKDKCLHQFKLRIINPIFCCQKKIQIKLKREEERDDTEHNNLIFLLANLIRFLSWAYSVYSTRHMDLKK